MEVGKDYRSTTETGLSCLPWNWVPGVHNYCRNPETTSPSPSYREEMEEPWCYASFFH